jgi:hypothetical protein
MAIGFSYLVTVGAIAIDPNPSRYPGDSVMVFTHDPQQSMVMTMNNNAIE